MLGPRIYYISLQHKNPKNYHDCHFFLHFVPWERANIVERLVVDKKAEEMEHFELADMRQIIASICKRRSTTEIESKKGSGTGDKCDPLASWQRLIIKR